MPRIRGKEEEDRPYKVLIPGQQHPYPLRCLKDPRLGEAQRKKDAFYRRHNLSDDDRSPDESEDEIEEDKTIKTVIIQIPMRLSRTTELILPNYNKKMNEKRRLLHEKKQLKSSVKNEAKHLKQQDSWCAEEAIKFYNKQHDTDYEIVETLGSFRTQYIGFWFHCNFRAQCKSDTHSSPRLFFAEIRRYAVLVCKIVDGPDAPGTGVGCNICGNYLVHPLDGLKIGREDKKKKVAA